MTLAKTDNLYTDMTRSVVFGFDDATFGEQSMQRVEWVEEYATNAHMLVAGKSGTGKTFTLRRIVNQLIKPLAGRDPVRVHCFDVHGDIRFPEESRFLFSESTHYGINPLKLSANPHYGGVRKCVQSFIDMVNDSAPRAQLGHRQVSALRNTLYDLFEHHGFMVNDPTTWAITDTGDMPTPDAQGRIHLDVPFDEKDLAKRAAELAGLRLTFDPEKRSWWCSEYRDGLMRWPSKISGRRLPTMPDVSRFLSQRIAVMATGGGNKAMRLLEEHNKKVAKWQVLLRKMRAGGSAQEVEDIKADVESSSLHLIESFTEYVMNIETGRELDALTRYESTDTMRSLADRMETLLSTGIFKPRHAPFDERCPVWSYDLAPLRGPEQQFFVWTRLAQILDEAFELGPVAGASEVRTVILLDEAHLFFSEKDTNVLDRIAKEGRKFGISLICASQAPSHFSEAFLGNVGTKVLLGLDAMYHDQTVRKMRIDPAILDYVVAGKVAAVQVSDKRNHKHCFRKTRVGQ